jgi:hypothetical protein
LRADRAVHSVEHLRVAWQQGVGRRHRLCHGVIPFGGEVGARWRSRRKARSTPKPLTKRCEINLRIGDKRQGAVLYRIVSRDIQLD